MSDETIWRYESADGGHKAQLVDLGGNVFRCVTVGRAAEEGVQQFYDFLVELARQRGRPLRILADNRQAERVEPGARRIAARFVVGGYPLERIAAWGDNFFMRAFFNLYAVVAQVPVKSFTSEPEAIAWLREEGGA